MPNMQNRCARFSKSNVVGSEKIVSNRKEGVGNGKGVRMESVTVT